MPRLMMQGVPAVPKGTIQTWHGTLATIPKGWTLCEGLIERGTNMVSHHTLDNTLNDTKGTNHGTVTGTTTYSSDRVLGTHSFSFDGASRITLNGDVETNYDFEYTNDFAISLWAKSSGANLEFLTGKRAGLNAPTEEGYSLAYDASGNVEFTLCDGTTEFIVTTENVDYRNNLWHNIVGTFNGNSDRSGMEVWIDSKPAMIGTGSAISVSILNNLFPTIGADNAGNHPYTGLIDDVRYYNTALNVHDIRRIYANPPNLLARFLRCVPTNSTEAGTLGGEDTHVLTTGEMPSHTHTFSESNHSHTLALDTGNQNNGNGANDGASQGGSGGASFNTATTFASTGVTISNTGSGSAHENKPAYYQVAYIMKTSDW